MKNLEEALQFLVDYIKVGPNNSRTSRIERQGFVADLLSFLRGPDTSSTSKEGIRLKLLTVGRARAIFLGCTPDDKGSPVRPACFWDIAYEPLDEKEMEDRDGLLGLGGRHFRHHYIAARLAIASIFNYDLENEKEIKYGNT